MEIKIKETREIEVISDILCDSCGQSCRDVYGNYEHIDMHANWGYGSKKDMERWTAHVCEKCVDEKLPFINFKKENLEFQTTIGSDSEMSKKIDTHELKYASGENNKNKE